VIITTIATQQPLQQLLLLQPSKLVKQTAFFFNTLSLPFLSKQQLMRPVILFLIITFLILAGCSPTVIFNSPQPTDKRDLGKFPSRYFGKYEEIEDSSLFILENYLIREQYTEDMNVPKIEIDTSKEFILKDDIVYIPETGEEVPVTIRNDSIFGTYITYDTVFRISDENILRKFRGYYFMNIRNDEEEWIVYRLKFRKDGNASLCGISEDDEIDRLKEITTVIEEKNDKDEVIKYIIKPEKGDFKQIIKEEHFKDCTEYRKVGKK